MRSQQPAPTFVTSTSTTETAAQIAAALHHAGWAAPLYFALDAGRPLAFLSAQCLYIAQPALSLFLPRTTINQLAHLLEEPAGVELLLEKLEIIA